MKVNKLRHDGGVMVEGEGIMNEGGINSDFPEAEQKLRNDLEPRILSNECGIKSKSKTSIQLTE